MRFRIVVCRLAGAGAAAIAALHMPLAAAQSWRPDKPVELVIPTAPGANNDRMIRIIQKIMQEQKLVTSPVLALNKPGGNQHLSFLYLVQKGADPHALLLSNSTIFTNELSGISPHPHTALTPVSLLVIESNAFTVHASSPMKSMRDLMERLAANPESVSFAMPARGGVVHLTTAAAAKVWGIDAKRLKVVVFKASGESMTGLAGGHVDVMVSSLASVMPHAKAERCACSASPRHNDAAAPLPTCRRCASKASRPMALRRGADCTAPKGSRPRSSASGRNRSRAFSKARSGRRASKRTISRRSSSEAVNSPDISKENSRRRRLSWPTWEWPSSEPRSRDERRIL